MRQVGRSVQCRQNRRGRTAATWPFLMSDLERTIEKDELRGWIKALEWVALDNPWYNPWYSEPRCRNVSILMRRLRDGRLACQQQSGESMLTNTLGRTPEGTSARRTVRPSPR